MHRWLSSLMMIAMCSPWLFNATCYGQGVETPAAIAKFFANHCSKCHSKAAKESEFRIDETLFPSFEDPALRERWSEIVNALNSHEMPPESEPQPAVADVAQVVDWITDGIVAAELKLRENQVVMRRLNRVEYRNSIKELTGIDFDISNFPQDPPAGGFDNIGSALTFSPMQMELYLEAAQQVMAKGLVEGEQPPSIRWRFEIDSGDSDSNRVVVDGQRPIVNGGNNRVQDGYKLVHHDSWDKKLNVRDFAMKDAGVYIVRIRAAGSVPERRQVVESAKTILQKRLDEQMANNPKGEKWHREQMERDLAHFQNDRMYDYGPARAKLVLDLGGQPRTITEFDVTGSLAEPKIYEIPVEFTKQRAGITVEYAYSIPRVLENFWFQGADSFARPELLVDWIEIEGPIHPTWPPESHRRIISEEIENKQEEEWSEKVIGRFVRRAFRRPVSREEARPYVEIFANARKQGLTQIEALRSALGAVLVSPNFLYLVETRANEADTKLNPHQLASRLSYFLWSTPPDAELMKDADQKKLVDPATITKQVERMLNDPRSEELVRNFTDQWLGLREVGANPPAADLYPQYDRHLEISMIEEGRALFRTILRDDKNVLDFIDPKYVVINERLARYYGFKDVRGDRFQVVPVAAGHPRGGILTQTAMLCITSNGTRTSPVKRGTWILKNVLGTDPGLPVANAGDIAPKVPGIDKATVRKRLEIHRELPQCARCHDKIDPLGLALENFNASGEYREQEGFGYKGRIERDDPKIDASAQLPDGTKINGAVDLKDAVRKQEDLFLKCLAQKLLTYALGRETTLADQPTIDEIVAKTKKSGYRLKGMVQAVVESEAFLSY
jgi:hypothetical protein